MTEEIQEMHEHAEEAHRDPSLVPVTLSMAILAVVLAAISLLGHRTHTEELLLQSKATDQWAYYQAKNIRRHSYELFLDLLSVISAKDPEAAEKIKEKYRGEIERYKDDQKDIQSEAQQLEKEVATQQHKANRFDLGEVCLEVGIVLTSLTLLTRRKLFWQLGGLAGLVGLAIAASGFWAK
jgi:phosphate uptake regulator